VPLASLKYQVTNHPGKKIRNVREHNSNKQKVNDGERPTRTNSNIHQ